MRSHIEGLCSIGALACVHMDGRDVDCAMDRVGENLAIVRSVLLPSAYLLLDQRDKVELRGC